MAEQREDLKSVDPVRVLHLIDGLGGGGSERWVWDIVRLSQPALCKHFVITVFPDDAQCVYSEPLRSRGAYGQPRHSPSLEWLERVVRKLAPIPYVWPLRKVLSAMWRLLNALSVTWYLAVALVRFAPDVVHVHTFRGLRAGVLIGRIFRLPLVHSVPALFSQMTDAGFEGIPRFYRSQERWIARFVTGASVSELLSLKIPTGKIMAIHGTIDLKSVHRVHEQKQYYYSAIRREVTLSPDSLIALSVGRLHPSKGHLFALEAMQHLVRQFPHLHWIVLGEGDQRAELEARARLLHLEEHVHLLGFQREPLPYYAAGNIYLRTPVFESENLSSYQAMAMGLPVVGFDTGCETELLAKSGHGVLVPTKNSDALAGAVAGILSLPDRGVQIGARGADYCREHLDIARTISELTDLYRSLGRKEEGDCPSVLTV